MKINLLFNLLFPEICVSCQEGQLTIMKPLCDLCLEKLELIHQEERCPKCGGILQQNSCICSETSFFFEKSFFMWRYQRESRKLLQQAKFNQRRSAVQYIKNHIPVNIWETLEEYPNAAILILPSSHSLLKKITKFLASESSLPLYDIFFKRDKKLQSKLMHKVERFSQIEKNLGIHSKKLKAIQNKKNYSHFILVDDVWTSGATMGFASRLLHEEGVGIEKIYTLAFFKRDRKKSKLVQ